MTISQIEKLNIKFQADSLGLVELIPDQDIMRFSTHLKRMAKSIHESMEKLLSARSVKAFSIIENEINGEMDDLLFELDRLHDINCILKIKAIDRFLKGGYDLLSIYSMAYDHILKQKVKDEKIG